MEYVIEGTVKELEVKKENGAWSFKIAGTDGYALRRKKKEDDKETTRLNALCLEDSKKTDDKTPRKAIVFAEESPFKTEDKEYGCLLALALANGKKCRICFLVVEKGNEFDSTKCTISSLTLLAE